MAFLCIQLFCFVFYLKHIFKLAQYYDKLSLFSRVSVQVVSTLFFHSITEKNNKTKRGFLTRAETALFLSIRCHFGMSTGP